MAQVELTPLPPEEAIAFFRAKGLAESFAWQDLWQEEHAKAFTVAKAMERNVLETIREAVDRAIVDGITFETFREELTPRLQDMGWWGRKPMTDPADGETREVQLGSPRRLRTIFNMNLRQAHAAGRWVRAEQDEAFMPLLRYVATGGSAGDGRTRIQHRAWHGTILPIRDVWWQTHYAPCDWECRCTTQQLNARTAARNGWPVGEVPAAFPPKAYTNPRTGEVTVLEQGIGPGFNYNVGQAYLRRDTPTLLSGSGETLEATATGEGRQSSIAAFLAPFVSEEKDRVWFDGEGYPQVVGPSLFLDSGGDPIRLSAEQLAQLPAVADALTDPTSIGWVWIRVGDRPAMLMRRYRSPSMTVDIASGGGAPAWRFSAR